MNLKYMAIAGFLAFSHSMAFADGTFNGDWFFIKGMPQEKQTAESQYDFTFVGSAAQLHLVQNGSHVSGTWSKTTDKQVQSGSLKGVIEGDTLRIYLCNDGGGSNEPYDCPDYPAQFDYLVMHQTYLAWYKYSPSGFDRYLTLERPASHTNPINPRQIREEI
jgi:hypothetical protein